MSFERNLGGECLAKNDIGGTKKAFPVRERLCLFTSKDET
jgi:hypothetical protein